MTTLNGDACPRCGYAFEVFDRGACPRCYSGYRASADRSGRILGFSASELRSAGTFLGWVFLMVAVADASCHWVLAVLANL